MLPFLAGPKGATAVAGLLQAIAKLSPPMITAVIAANPNGACRSTPASASGPGPEGGDAVADLVEGHHATRH